MAPNSGNRSLCIVVLMPKDTKSVRGFGSAPLRLTCVWVPSGPGLSKPMGVSGSVWGVCVLNTQSCEEDTQEKEWS